VPKIYLSQSKFFSSEFTLEEQHTLAFIMCILVWPSGPSAGPFFIRSDSEENQKDL